MQTGNVVEWLGKFYIVTKTSYDGGELSSLTLIPLTNTNTSSHPSRTWPDDPEKRIQSVKLVSETIADFILDKCSSPVLQQLFKVDRW